MRIDFDEAKHEYKIDGVTVPSVTEICKPLSVDIAANAKSWLREQAAAKGTLIHELCADYDFQLGFDGLGPPPEYEGYIHAYLDFLRDYRIREWMAVEYMIGDGKLGIAGTIDRVGIIDRELSVVDLKTGTRIDRPYLTAQLNGYRHLWNQSMKQNITRMYGLQLKRDGTYRLIPCEYSPIFFMLLRVYSERKQLQCRNSK